MKSMLLLILLSISVPAFAPGERAIILSPGERISPFERLCQAIVAVESSGDTKAVNPSEKAFGAFQIRPIRLQDYFERTGIRYSLTDMLDYDKAKRVFIFYCCLYGHHNLDEIILNWNCQSRKYLARVKKYL